LKNILIADKEVFFYASFTHFYCKILPKKICVYYWVWIFIKATSNCFITL